MLEPGESITVPVYYAGMQQPWSSDASFNFELDVYPQKDKAHVDWSSMESSLQPPGLSSQAWAAIYAGITSQLGDTFGGYVTMLENESTSWAGSART